MIELAAQNQTVRLLVLLVIFMVTADTAPPLPTFRFRWLKAVRSA